MGLRKQQKPDSLRTMRTSSPQHPSHEAPHSSLGPPPALRETADKPLRSQCRGHTQLWTVRLPLGVSPCTFHVCEMELQQSRKDQGKQSI